MDSKTFKDVFIPYHEKLYRIAYRITDDSDIAQDLVQETYIKLWNNRERWATLKSTEAYAVVVLKNTCIDYLKKENRYKKTTLNDESEKIVDVDALEQKDDEFYIKSIVNSLPQQQQLAFWMKHWDGYSNEEIEKILGVSAVNLRVILSRARTKVKDQFLKLKRK
ncbi:sigma-70 family RNA polymerase sigma factor [Myroides phaeus]|uniref:RNA polymerase sigma factor n=1 Tax=Myroides phaeus TaxID=702745 RepID=UPI002DB80F6F|nr:sigma-70 family RNA polymerase sigma factor [Myroides phaeus]MEC4115609.1 sigma-70 family RNA polymerase sigma factor [Myroides phaeus]